MINKWTIAGGAIVVVSIVFVPIRPVNGDRPRMTHKQWSSISKDVPEILDYLADRKHDAGGETIPVNIEELTGLHGISLVGAECFLGSRTISTVGYLPKGDTADFYTDNEAVWLDSEAKRKLTLIKKQSEQGGTSNGG
jgi:hypothetical protein